VDGSDQVNHKFKNFLRLRRYSQRGS
jgi:hypothetical protein